MNAKTDAPALPDVDTLSDPHWSDHQLIARGLPEGRRAGVSIKLKSSGRGLELSICGAVGHANSFRAGDADCCGQCIDDIAEIPDDALCNGWTPTDRDALVMIWRAWHLNSMNAGCRHQRAAGWGRGYVGQPCPICGYRYGSEWLHEPLPAEIIAWTREHGAIEAPVTPMGVK